MRIKSIVKSRLVSQRCILNPYYDKNALDESSALKFNRMAGLLPFQTVGNLEMLEIELFVSGLETIEVTPAYRKIHKFTK
jgi:hypothetical protein